MQVIVAALDVQAPHPWCLKHKHSAHNLLHQVQHILLECNVHVQHKHRPTLVHKYGRPYSCISCFSHMAFRYMLAGCAQVHTEPALGIELSRLQRLSIHNAWHSTHALGQLRTWARSAANSVTLLCLTDEDAGEQSRVDDWGCKSGLMFPEHLRHTRRADEPHTATLVASGLAPIELLRSLQCLCLDGAMSRYAVAYGLLSP